MRYGEQLQMRLRKGRLHCLSRPKGGKSCGVTLCVRCRILYKNQQINQLKTKTKRGCVCVQNVMREEGCNKNQTELSRSSIFFLYER